MDKRVTITFIILVLIISLSLGIVAGQRRKIIEQKDKIVMLQIELDSLKETVYQQQLTLNSLKGE